MHDDELVGQVIGDYDIFDAIGHGGMGVVYQARQMSLDRIVAFKVLPAKMAQDQDYVERFLREARSAAQMVHPNIIRVYDFGQLENTYFFVMEYVSGVNLNQYVYRKGPLSERESIDIMMQVCAGLEYAHNNRIIHRDIKPENLMIMEDGRVKIGDLGLAKWAHQSESLTKAERGTALGTPHYISPEQVRGEEAIDRRADIYSLGATLFYLVTGRTPFQGQNSSEIMSCHLKKDIPSPSSIRPGLSEGICFVIQRMMLKPVHLRYQSMREVAKDLELLANKRDPQAKAFFSSNLKLLRVQNSKFRILSAIQELSLISKLALGVLIVVTSLLAASFVIASKKREQEMNNRSQFGIYQLPPILASGELIPLSAADLDAESSLGQFVTALQSTNTVQIMDAAISAQFPWGNTGEAEELKLSEGNRVLLKIDLPEEVVNQAKLISSQDIHKLRIKLNLSFSSFEGTAVKVYLYRLLKPWQEGRGSSQNNIAKEGEVCWSSAEFSRTDWAASGGNEPGVDRAAVPSGEFTLDGEDYFSRSIDVSADYISWLSGTHQNFGWIFILEDPNAQILMRSSEYSSETQRPSLEFFILKGK